MWSNKHQQSLSSSCAYEANAWGFRRNNATVKGQGIVQNSGNQFLGKSMAPENQVGFARSSHSVSQDSRIDSQVTCGFVIFPSVVISIPYSPSLVVPRIMMYGFIKIRMKVVHFIKKFSSKTTFIKNHFHQKPLSSKTISSKTTFIKNHFHQKPLSSKTTFIKNHFHQNPLPSKTTFIKNHFHQKPLSSKNHFHQKPLSKILDPKPQNESGF